MDKFEFNKAVNYHKKNQLKKAIKIYLKIVSQSENEEVLFLLGTAFFQNNEFESSIKYLKRLIQINPKNFHAYANLAQALCKVDLLDEAIKSFEQSILINPNFSHNYNNLGNLYFSIKNYEKALNNLNKAIQLEKNIDFYFNRSKIYEKLGMLFDGLADINIFIQHNPQSLNAQILKINLLIRLQKYKECWSCLMNLDQSDQEVIIRQVQLCFAHDDIELSYQYIEKIKDLNIKYFYLSFFYYKKGFLDESISTLNLISEANHNSNIINNYGLIYRDAGDEGKAASFFSKAIHLNPDNKFAKLNMGLIQLKNYNFKDGWNNYYHREKPSFECLQNIPEWKREDLPSEETMVIAEQGVGDQILFLNILNYLVSNNFTFTVDHRLIADYQYSYPLLNFICTDEISKFKFKHFIYLGDFAKYFIKSKDDFISINSTFKENIKFIFNHSEKGSKKIGISWKSTKSLSESHSRSINLLDLMSPLKLIDVSFYSLQYGEVLDDIMLIKDQLSINIIREDFDYFNDLSKLLSLIHALDLVITTDNVTAHLAGACGKETYLLVPDKRSRVWFWHNEIKSSWYPNTTIYFFNETNLKNILIEISSKIN